MIRSCHLVPCLLIAMGAAAPPAQAQEPREFTVVASGGISRGAYQAGVAYLNIRDIKLKKVEAERKTPTVPFPGLTAATGASAGNINVFLAAIMWLQDEAALRQRGLVEGVTENVFWDSWINIGWDKLSPHVDDLDSYRKLFQAPLASPTFPSAGEVKDLQGDEPIFRRNDGLLARRAFSVAIENVQRRLALPVYPCDARLVLGITLTGEQTYSLPLDGGGALTARAQRYVVPLQVASTCTGGRLGVLAIGNFEADGWKQDDYPHLGRIFRFGKKDSQSSIESGVLTTAVQAASAFPIAFAPLTLRDPNLPTSARFFDGGLFDNVPLGLAIELQSTLHDTAPEAQKRLAQVRYNFVETGVRRAEPVGATAARAGPEGLAYTVAFLGRFVDQARNYELQGTVRYRQQEASQIRTTSRYFPIIGDFFAGFGAFFHRDFRRYDYFVGAYDYLFFATEEEYRLNHPASPYPTSTADWQDFNRRFVGLRDKLMVQPPGEPSCRFQPGKRDVASDTLQARSIVTEMLAAELDWRAPGVVVTDRLKRCRDNPDIQHADPLWSVFDTLTRLDRARRDQAHRGGAGAVDVDDFLRGLPAPVQDEAVAQVTGGGWQTERGVEGLYQAMLNRLVRRAIDIERADRRVSEDQEDQAREAVRTLQIGRLVLNTALPYHRQGFELDLDPSTVRRMKDGWSPAHLLPYYLRNEPFGCTSELGWEPRLRIQHFFASFTIGPQMSTCLEGGRDYGVTLAPGVGWEFGAWADVILAGAWTRSLGRARPLEFGPALTVDVFRKLRLSLALPHLRVGGQWTTTAFDSWTGLADSLSFSIGLADLNGVVQWLFGALRWWPPRESEVVQ